MQPGASKAFSLGSTCTRVLSSLHVLGLHTGLCPNFIRLRHPPLDGGISPWISRSFGPDTRGRAYPMHEPPVDAGSREWLMYVALPCKESVFFRTEPIQARYWVIIITWLNYVDSKTKLWKALSILQSIVVVLFVHALEPPATGEHSSPFCILMWSNLYMSVFLCPMHIIVLLCNFCNMPFTW